MDSDKGGKAPTLCYVSKCIDKITTESINDVEQAKYLRRFVGLLLQRVYFPDYKTSRLFMP